MQILKLLAVATIALSVSLFLLNTIYLGLKTGKIGHSTSNAYCHKAKNPIGYWSLVSLFLLFIAILAFGLWRVLVQTFNN